MVGPCTAHHPGQVVLLDVGEPCVRLEVRARPPRAPRRPSVRRLRNHRQHRTLEDLHLLAQFRVDQRRAGGDDAEESDRPARPYEGGRPVVARGLVRPVPGLGAEQQVDHQAGRRSEVLERGPDNVHGQTGGRPAEHRRHAGIGLVRGHGNPAAREESRPLPRAGPDLERGRDGRGRVREGQVRHRLRVAEPVTFVRVGRGSEERCRFAHGPDATHIPGYDAQRPGPSEVPTEEA